MTATPGYNGTLLRVDLGTGATRVLTPPADDYRRYVGGGLMGTKLLLDLTPAGLDPFAPEALLTFWSSVIAGHPYVGLPRFAVLAKSPLTGGIGEARVEGPFGLALKASGHDGLIIGGAADRPVYLLVEDGRPSLHDAGALWGLDTAAATDRLVERHGPDAHVAVIGEAGESLVRFASIVTDRTFPAARMGLGAVMGSKRLKAVVITGGSAPAVHDAAELERLTAEYAGRIAGNDLTTVQHDPPGFGAWIADGDANAGYGGGTNYSTSRLPAVPGDMRERLVSALVKGEGNCPGCPNDCIKIFDNGVDARAGGLHQEAFAAFGLGLGITDTATLLDLNARCHLWGVDPVSLAFTVSFACEAAARGMLDARRLGAEPPAFGDTPALVAFLETVALGREPVRLLSEGVRRAADALGEEFGPLAMHVKGLEMVSFEPRASAGQALAYAVSPVGPRYEIVEHDIDFDPVGGWRHGLDQMRTLGTLEYEPMELLDDRRVVRTGLLVDMWSGMDALCLSLFAGPPVRELDLPGIARLVAAVTGWRTSDSELFVWGRRRWQLMRVYNLREGLRAADDALPRRFHEEPVDAGRHQGVLLDEDGFAAALRLYYRITGWDDDGVPTPETLRTLDLTWAEAHLPRR
ncbi:aldehyde ferredoxin oxidoreductase family protein [Streptosporangium longisporum]